MQQTACDSLSAYEALGFTPFDQPDYRQRDAWNCLDPGFFSGSVPEFRQVLSTAQFCPGRFSHHHRYFAV
jgi:hypothetical protein